MLRPGFSGYFMSQGSNASCTAVEEIRMGGPEKEINTPKREALLLSPSALVQVGASPHSKRYSAMRKIDFSSGTPPASRRLSFT